ncbi:MAG: tRNA uridine-5-carboxymethylaminomethyl(34) synthesis enzyme MnmG, partial [Pseudomonadota bacterium]
FTSRAEYRLRLREDNADQRLTEQGVSLGLVGSARSRAFAGKMDRLDELRRQLESTNLVVGSSLSRELEAATGESVTRDTPLPAFLRRPAVSVASLVSTDRNPLGIPDHLKQDRVVLELAETEIKYAGYIKRQDEEIQLIRRHESLAIPEEIDYDALAGLSNELRQKLAEARPLTLAQASRVPGVTPAALSLLLIEVQRRKRQAGEQRLAEA